LIGVRSAQDATVRRHHVTQLDLSGWYADALCASACGKRGDWIGAPAMEKVVMDEQLPPSGSAFQAIRAIDYTVIFVRDMEAMRRFYEDVLGLALRRELSPSWIEYQLGDNTLALARPSLTAADAPTPIGSASLQLAFKVASPEVDRCAEELVRHRIDPVGPPTDQPFGHRTLFFRDPDGNLLEIFAEIGGGSL
jgi:catechol 2,3-dioxygenase-like lactoylglutathione lyase family enzyme